MKFKGMREVRENLSDVLEESQSERVVVTRHGKPSAMIVGIEGEDLEKILLLEDEELWRALARSRKRNKTYSSEQVRELLGASPKEPSPRRRRGTRRRSS